MWRNYGRHDKKRGGFQFDIPELTIDTVYHPQKVDNTFELPYDWPERADGQDDINDADDLIAVSPRPEVQLSDIIKPAKRKGKGNR